MTSRATIEDLLRELYATRLRGDLDGMLHTFTDDAKFEIAGATDTSPVTISAAGRADIRAWLALLIKTFNVSDQEILSLVIDDARAAVHWRGGVRSRITGVSILTEFIDVISVRDGRIATYTEFFIPRQGA